MCLLFFNQYSIWRKYGISKKMLQKESFNIFQTSSSYLEYDQAVDFLNQSLNRVNSYLLTVSKEPNSYIPFLKYYFIFDEIMNSYMEEKKERHEILIKGIRNENGILDIYEKNRNIERNIIDACNIWIENTVIFQNKLDIKNINVKKEFKLDKKLLINLYLYGLISKSLSLLKLSKQLKKEYQYTGLKIDYSDDEVIELIKYHPFVFFNTLVCGNQNIFVSKKDLETVNETEFGQGFLQHTNINFLCFIAALYHIKKVEFNNNMLAFNILEKKGFLRAIETYTDPIIKKEAFDKSFILSKEKLESQLRDGETILWKVGSNEFRHELRPFIELSDGNLLLSCSALEQSINIWHNYFMNGGKCYSNVQSDQIILGLEKRNNQISNQLVDKIIQILSKNFKKTFCEKNVSSERIFGKLYDENHRLINYGDFDIVFFDNDKKELFLIESKYFSDSFNTSSMINDYKKMFKPNGYLDHCLKRFELVLQKGDQIKNFIKSNDSILVHMMFISSKPLEMEIQDKSKTAFFLPLSVFEEYLNQRLYGGETGETLIYSNVKI